MNARGTVGSQTTAAASSVSLGMRLALEQDLHAAFQSSSWMSLTYANEKRAPSAFIPPHALWVLTHSLQ